MTPLEIFCKRTREAIAFWKNWRQKPEQFSYHSKETQNIKNTTLEKDVCLNTLYVGTSHRLYMEGNKTKGKYRSNVILIRNLVMSKVCQRAHDTAVPRQS